MSNKRNSVLSHAAFYAIMLFCLLGIGAGGWLLLSPDEEPPETPPENQQPVISAADTDDTLTAVVSPVIVTDKEEPPETPPETEPDPGAVEVIVPDIPDIPEPPQEEIVVTVVAPVRPEPEKPVVEEPSDPVVKPLDGEVAAVFSMDELAYNETLGDWRTHDGIDICAEAGTAVLAASAGTVESITEDSLLGTTVVIQHSDGYRTTYACLEPELAVEYGDTVSSGQLIGAVGTSAAGEAAFGPHLHFSVSRNSIPVDPTEYLEG